MNLYTFIDYLEQNMGKIKELMRKKNEDYANDEDIFANFKRMAEIARIEDLTVKTEEGIMSFMGFMKEDRKWNVAKKRKQANNEGFIDSVIDQFVYGNLEGAWLKDLGEAMRKGLQQTAKEEDNAD